MNLKTLLLTAAGWLLHTSSFAQSIDLVNPMLAGFYPDPSLVQVGPGYYLVNSTFAYFPGSPVLHSRDLKTWQQMTGNPAFIGKRQQLYCITKTALTFAPKAANEKAGLVVFQDEKHFCYLCKSVGNGKPVLQFFKSTAGPKNMELLAQAPLGSATASVQLRRCAAGDTYGFSFSAGKAGVVLKDQVDARFLSTQVAGGFMGCVLGMCTTSSG